MVHFPWLKNNYLLISIERKMIETYEGMLITVTEYIDCLSMFLEDKVKQKQDFKAKIQEFCPHIQVLRIKEDGDDRAHTECLRCKKWNCKIT